MDLDLSNPDRLRECREAIQSLVSGEWLEKKLATLERERNRNAGIERHLLRKPTHPIVEWESKVDQWIGKAEAGQQLGDAAVFEFGRAAWLIEHARGLPGGAQFLDGLAHVVIGQRTTSRSIRQFDDLLFEAEAALYWARGNNLVQLEAPGGNPDFSFLIQDPNHAAGSWRVPVECWRPARSVEYTPEFEDVWKQIQRRLLKLTRVRDVALKVSIRTQTDLKAEHIEPLLQEVERLIPSALQAGGRWVTSSIEEGSFQVSIGDIRNLAKGKVITEFSVQDLDMAAEPPLTLAVRGVKTDAGILGDGIALALRPTSDPGWLADHVGKKLSDKATQLGKSCGGQTAPVGLLAVRLPPVNRTVLFDIDAAVRKAITNRDHVAAVILYLTEPISGATPLDGEKVEIMEGRRLLTYIIVNGKASAIPGLEDSRDDFFDPEELHGIVVDARNGSMERTGYGLEDGPELHTLTELEEWPRGIESRLPQGLNPKEDGFGLKLSDVESFFAADGDQLLLEIKTGHSTFRLVRDRHLNLRWLRIGGQGRLRDHVVVDARPFRNAKSLIICPVWDEGAWRLIVGSEVEGHQVEARRSRGG